MQAPDQRPQSREYSRHIHLLYVPTLGCNLSCSYCYLGEQTTQATLKKDAARATATLRHALDKLEEAGVLAFNVSLHGGEVTTMPTPVLEELFTLIHGYYLDHFDALTALGHAKSAPHIKTNLYKFAPLYDLFVRHKVSISASIDLPLALHDCACWRATRTRRRSPPRSVQHPRLRRRAADHLVRPQEALRHRQPGLRELREARHAGDRRPRPGPARYPRGPQRRAPQGRGETEQQQQQ
jgi:uncharacterized protein